MTDQTDTDNDPYGDGPAREYKAGRGGKHCLHLRFVPNGGNYDRQLPFHDIRDTWIRKDGREIRLDFSTVTVIIVGRYLLALASAIGAHQCSCVEAFNPKLRDMPADEQPFVESITYHEPQERDEPLPGKAR
jgi:hypothetical protein